MNDVFTYKQFKNQKNEFCNVGALRLISLKVCLNITHILFRRGLVWEREVVSHHGKVFFVHWIK